MSKLRFSYLIFLILAFFLHSKFALASDHGDTFEDATPVAIGSVTNGRTYPTGDPDYFRFTVNQRNKYFIFSRGITDVMAYLYDANYERLGYNYDSGEDQNFRIEIDLSPGIYYLKVMGDNSYSTIGNYAVHIEGPGKGTTTDDHGSSPWSATRVAIGSITNGRLDLQEDGDYFKFIVGELAKYVIYSRGITDVWASLYNELYFERVAYDYDDGEEDNFRIEIELSPGTYYLKVEEHWNAIGNYSIHIEGWAKGTESDDHGLSPWSATPVAVSSTTPGRIDIPDDRDYFAFTASATSLYTIYTTGIIDTYGELYDSQFNRLTYDYNDGEVDNFRIEHTLSPGLYFVMVKGQSHSSTYGDYNLHVSGPSAPPPDLPWPPKPIPKEICFPYTPSHDRMLMICWPKE